MLLHLLQRSVNPALALRVCLENWTQISLELREPPRERGLQVERLESGEAVLS